MLRPSHAVLAWGSLLLIGCVSAEPFDLSAWALAPREDPFPDHGLVVECDGFDTDEGVLEVDMESCPYAVFSQRTQRAIRRGERLVGGMSHDVLWSEDTGHAHGAIELDGQVLWEVTPYIPHPPEFHVLDVVVDRRVPRGALVVFHLHNHGLNSYRLLPIEVVE